MTRLEKATHVFLILVCCVSIYILAEARFSRGSRQSAAALPDPVGRPVRLSGVDWSASPVTVLLHISSACHFCNESMPFYQKLASVRRQPGTRMALVVSSQDPIAVMENHLAEQNVAVDKVLHARLDSIGVRGTPTALIIDSQGIVRRAFRGKLSAAREQELLAIAESGRL